MSNASDEEDAARPRWNPSPPGRSRAQRIRRSVPTAARTAVGRARRDQRSRRGEMRAARTTWAHADILPPHGARCVSGDRQTHRFTQRYTSGQPPDCIPGPSPGTLRTGRPGPGRVPRDQDQRAQLGIGPGTPARVSARAHGGPCLGVPARTAPRAAAPTRARARAREFPQTQPAKPPTARRFHVDDRRGAPPTHVPTSRRRRRWWRRPGFPLRRGGREEEGGKWVGHAEYSHPKAQPGWGGGLQARW
jgi:hypothetical protein